MPVAPVAMAQGVHPYFYRVEFQGRTSWILGTFPTTNYPNSNVSIEDYDPSLLEAILKARKGLVQSQFDFYDGLSNGLGPYMKGKKSLRDVLSRGAWTRYEKWTKYVTKDLPTTEFRDGLQRVPPGVAVLVLWERGLRNVTFFGPRPSLRAQIRDKFVERKTPFETIEDPYTLYGYFAGHVDAAGANAFIMRYLDSKGDPTIKTAQEYGVAIPEDEKRYYEGTLDGHLVAEGELSAFLPNLMLLSRHLYWMNNLVDDFQKGSVFLAADVQHVEGQLGIVALLRERGFRVEKMSCDGFLSSTSN
jgi:hypothetical protein